MSEQPDEQQPSCPPRLRPLATAKDLLARFHGRALAWYGRNDLPAMPVPDPPAAIQNVNPIERRQRSPEVWQAAYRLLQALDVWHDGFHKLKAEGDASPASALGCHETALQGIRVLCSQRVQISPFDRESEANLIAMLPPIPDWSLAGIESRWDQEQGQFISYQRPRWQEDPHFLHRSYGGPENRGDASNRLRGATFPLLLFLRKVSHDCPPFRSPRSTLLCRAGNGSAGA